MYYLGSDDDSPDRLHFSFEAAQKAQHYYIDVFDKDGNLITTFKYVDDKYTSFF